MNICRRLQCCHQKAAGSHYKFFCYKTNKQIKISNFEKTDLEAKGNPFAVENPTREEQTVPGTVMSGGHFLSYRMEQRRPENRGDKDSSSCLQTRQVGSSPMDRPASLADPASRNSRCNHKSAVSLPGKHTLVEPPCTRTREPYRGHSCTPVFQETSS